MEQMKNAISLICKKLYDFDGAIDLAEVPENMPGDYATNVALRLAKVAGKAPREIAEDIILELKKTLVAEFEVAGPGFINITVNAKDLKLELDQKWSEKYGNSDTGAGRLAIVEFPSPNMAKPYSVGHLRPGNQGWAVKKMLEATGWRVLTDNHLGDSGTPFGIWSVGFERSGKSLDEIDVYALGKIYIEMKRLLKEEEEAGGRELADAVQDWLLKLEQGDERALAWSQKFNEVSLKHIHEIMGRLGLETDYELGESFFVEQGKDLVEKYVAEGLFEKNADGSVICRLDEFGIDVPILAQKSNGAALYATTDLACMVYRAKEFAPDKVVYCVGQEQKFYFEQLFAMGKKLGLSQEKVHLWFGMIDQLVDGKREKMSSRKGVVLMEELLDKAEERARALTEGREVSEEDVKKIAVGAVKFTDFMAEKGTGILFDWEKIFALSGFSGPFCQYAIVRMNKILALNKDFIKVDYGDYGFEAEKDLLKLMLEFPQVVEVAAERLEGHRIANYVFKLAQEFNRYYEAVPVGMAGEIEKSARLDLLVKLSQVMTRALDLIGIAVPERM